MKRTLNASVSLFVGLTTLIAVVAVMAATPASASTQTCPTNPYNFVASNDVGAAFTVDGTGNTATYTLDTANKNPTDGVPGVIEYCIYSGSLPDSATALAVGADGGAWTDPPFPPNFSFQRPDGNPSNVPLDGRTGYTVGTATWNSGAPTDELIVIHINDAVECDALYGGNPGTCFVLPGTPGGGGGEGSALGITKDASGSYDDTFSWTITKDVDKTIVKQIGGSATFNYTVSVSHGDSVVSNVKVTGTITVNNPNADNVTIDGVTDQLSDGTVCTVTGGGSQSIATGDTALPYSCSLPDGSVPTGLTNTATVSWSDQTLGNGDTLLGGSADTAPVAVPFTGNEIDECVTVNDSYAGNLGTPCVGDPGDPTFTFKYSRVISIPQFDCVSYNNTATFTTNDTGSTGSASQTVTVCGPAKSGALTIGFWKQTNGQNLVNTYCVNGANNLGTYLAGLGGGSGPFSNAPTTCSAVKSYIYSILNGANAKNMNSMLKAQMLGTALDVWFSGPGWTSTKIGGIKPPSNFLSHNNLGTFKMDTTAVCPMVDNLNTGSATCLNNTPSTDAVAAGAVPSSPMSMQSILDYAATTPSPFNGSTSSSIWYGGDRTKEEILKNIFDQFNNQLAFGSF
jgi:hypothetical protein